MVSGMTGGRIAALGLAALAVATLTATEAGAQITSPTGGPLTIPLDVETDVAWVGYANRALQSSIEPVMQEVLRDTGLISGG